MSKASPPYSGPGEPPVQFVPSFGSERKYIIGDKTLDEPLVTTTQLRGHLALLDVFNRLKEEIDNIPPPYARSERPDGHDPLETQWNLFVSLATERCGTFLSRAIKLTVSRFERWVVGIRDVVIPDAMTLLPPLDVLMVCQSYPTSLTAYIYTHIGLVHIYPQPLVRRDAVRALPLLIAVNKAGSEKMRPGCQR